MDSVLVLGLSWQDAPVEAREALSIAPADLAGALAAAQERLGHAVLLSTCSRVEVYTTAADAECGFAAAEDFLARHPGGSAAARLTYRYAGEAAVRHLFRVASGLESMVLGEPQILVQARRAYEAALAAGSAGPVLSRLFQEALRAGKQVRMRTGLSRGAASLSGVAAELACRELPEHGGRTLIVGAGEMGKLAAAAVAGARAGEVVVLSRDVGAAQQLAARVGGRAARFAELGLELGRADVAIAATSARRPVISRSVVEAAVQARPRRPLAIVDLGLPRDVEPATAHVPGVRLYDLDALQSAAAEHLAERRRCLPEAASIVEAQVQAFMGWWRAQDVLPAIAALANAAEAICESETAKALHRLPRLGDAERASVERLARAIAGQVLHASVAALKEGAAAAATRNRSAAPFAGATREPILEAVT